MVRAGFTGRASGTVEIFQREGKGLATTALGKRSRLKSAPFYLGVAPSAIAIPFVVMFLLIIVAVISLVWYRKHRPSIRDPGRDTQTLASSEANGQTPRHTKRFWAYMVTTV